VSTHSSRVEVVEQLKKTPISDPSFAANLLQAFSAFDWDDSGMLDVDEARDLFHVLYYEKLGSADFAKAMLIVRQYADLRGELSFDSLVDALANVASVYEIEAPRFSTLSSGGFQSRWGDLASEAKARAPAQSFKRAFSGSRSKLRKSLTGGGGKHSHTTSQRPSHASGSISQSPAGPTKV